MKFQHDMSPVSIGPLQFTKVEDLAAYYYSPEFESEYTYYGHDLGATTREKDGSIETQFALWSPTADAVTVKLYKTGSDAEKGAAMLGEMPMARTGQGVWRVSCPMDLNGTYYTFLVTHGKFEAEIGDPYARACGVNGQRSMVVDLSKVNPEGWDEDHYAFTKAATKAVIWEVHVRDFSFTASSGMKNTGKYLAFTEKGTTVGGEGNYPTGIDYLKKLGITHVHLMPVFDYATVDEASPKSEQYNWGYDPLNYNVPEGSYATNPFDGNVRIREFKAMVKALHDAGIGVILDVVYNHTYHTKTSWFQRAVPFYYYRVLEDGRNANASGCGNETASERSMMRLYMLDSIKMWAEEYHLDGFRFDLMGLHDVDTIREVRSMLDQLPNEKQYLVYGEPWAAGTPAMPGEFMPADMPHSWFLPQNVAIFSDSTRDSIKGSAFRVYEPGFINGGSGQEEALKGAITAYHSKECPISPCKTITYVSAHDNFTLWDKIYMTVEGDGSGYDDPEMMRIAVNKLAAVLVLTSQGIPFMQAGEEFARTKYGDGNSYRSPSLINALHWRRTKRFEELVRYYRGLIKIRKAFSCFTDETGKAGESIEFSVAGDGIIAYTIRGQKKGEPQMMAVLVNASEEPKTIVLYRSDGEVPDEWVILADEHQAGLTPKALVTGRALTVQLRGAIVASSTAMI